MVSRHFNALSICLFAVLVSAPSSADGEGYQMIRSTVDGGGGASAGGNYSLQASLGQPSAASAGAGPYTLVGGMWSDAPTAPGSGCMSASDCADLDDDGVRDNACVFWACIEGACIVTDVPFADMGGQFGTCAPDGIADGNDRFHVLNCFANDDPAGEGSYPCEEAAPEAFNVDAGGPFGDCQPDGVCDGNDAFHALNAFAGISPCSCVGAPAPFIVDTVVDEASLVLEADGRVVPAGSTIVVDALLPGPLENLRGYQLHIGVTGGLRGSLELVDIAISRPTVLEKRQKDTGPTSVSSTSQQKGSRAVSAAASSQPWSAFNIASRQLLVGQDGAGGPTGSGYLGSFTFRASGDALGQFAIELLSEQANPAHRTFLFSSEPGRKIEVIAGKLMVIEVTDAR